jgi:signal transduction histidine kinase
LTFRTRLLISFVATVVLAVAVVAYAVSVITRRSFEQRDEQRTAALVAQFQREFARRGQEIARRLQGIAEAEASIQMAIALAGPNADASLYVNDALGLARSYQLDFLEIVNDDGRIISSAHFPARFGFQNDWVTQVSDWQQPPAFLRREELREGFALALLAVRTYSVGEKKIYFIGGERLDNEFLASLVLPEGMRALLYLNLESGFNPSALTDAHGPLDQAHRLQPWIEQIRSLPPSAAPFQSFRYDIAWLPDPASAETLHAIPLRGREQELLGVLMVGSSRREIVLLNRQIRWTALAVGGAGILLGILLSLWASARVTRPIRELAEGARAVAAGQWNVHVSTRAGSEVGDLARSFNLMTQQLLEQRERLLQAERVAAWRELARRLAHELKNPLFPLQITVENLQRARENNPAEFDEVFRESTQTLLAELANLKSIVARFSDFAKMPAPVLRPVNLNDVVREAVRVFDAQFRSAAGPQVIPELYLQEDLGTIQADPDLLHRALQNLILNARDAMPAGGTLTIRTRRIENGVQLEVQDTGVGLTREECERLFTPYYTTKLHGSGLGLAIVQSVVSDHHGRIFVESEPRRGTLFRIVLPAHPAVKALRPEKIPEQAAEAPTPVAAAAPAAPLSASGADSLAPAEAPPEPAEPPAPSVPQEVVLPEPAEIVEAIDALREPLAAPPPQEPPADRDLEAAAPAPPASEEEYEAQLAALTPPEDSDAPLRSWSIRRRETDAAPAADSPVAESPVAVAPDASPESAEGAVASSPEEKPEEEPPKKAEQTRFRFFSWYK